MPSARLTVRTSVHETDAFSYKALNNRDDGFEVVIFRLSKFVEFQMIHRQSQAGMTVDHR